MGKGGPKVSEHSFFLNHSQVVVSSFALVSKVEFQNRKKEEIKSLVKGFSTANNCCLQEFTNENEILLVKRYLEEQHKLKLKLRTN